MAGYRTVVHDRRFEHELKQISPTLEKIDEFIRAVEWAVARSPETAGIHIGQGVYMMKGRRSILGRKVVVYYSFNDEKVFLLSIVDVTDWAE